MKKILSLVLVLLMLLGVATLPLECRFFGVRAAVWRNALGLAYSFALALFMGALFGGVR